MPQHITAAVKHNMQRYAKILFFLARGVASQAKLAQLAWIARSVGASPLYLQITHHHRVTAPVPYLLLCTQIQFRCYSMLMLPRCTQPHWWGGGSLAKHIFLKSIPFSGTPLLCICDLWLTGWLSSVWVLQKRGLAWSCFAKTFYIYPGLIACWGLHLFAKKKESTVACANFVPMTACTDCSIQPPSAVLPWTLFLWMQCPLCPFNSNWSLPTILMLFQVSCTSHLAVPAHICCRQPYVQKQASSSRSVSKSVPGRHLDWKYSLPSK